MSFIDAVSSHCHRRANYTGQGCDVTEFGLAGDFLAPALYNHKYDFVWNLDLDFFIYWTVRSFHAPALPCWMTATPYGWLWNWINGAIHKSHRNLQITMLFDNQQRACTIKDVKITQLMCVRPNKFVKDRVLTPRAFSAPPMVSQTYMNSYLTLCPDCMERRRRRKTLSYGRHCSSQYIRAA